MAPPSILVIGSMNMDLVAFTNRMPAAGETLVGEKFQTGFGGKGANQAVMAQLLGANVRLANGVGDDAYGELMRDNLTSVGVDLTHVHVFAASSGIASIWVEADGSNRIIIVPGANHELTPEQARAAVTGGAAPAAVVGQFEIPQPVTTAGFLAGRDRGAITVLNPAPAATIDAPLLAATDWLVPNEVEFAELAGAEVSDAAILRFATAHATRLVVTLGAAGVALLAEDGTVHRIPAPGVEVVDTTGAGDAFVAAFAHGLASGWDDVRSARLGVVVASDTVTRAGAQSSFPTPAACRAMVGKVT